MSRNKTPISKAESYKEIGEFWDAHDLAEYWEHVIRDQDAFNRIHDYILTNPERRYLDRENPDRTGEDDFDRWLSRM